MTPIEHYSRIVDQIFGAASFTPKEPHTQTTPIVQALSDTTASFKTFQVNFRDRLSRLGSAYEDHPSCESLLTQVKEVGDPNNWQGAAAELAAIDFFCRDRDWLDEAPHLDVSLPAAESLACKFKMQQANLDLHFQEFDVYTDVKVLKDNVTEVIDGVLDEIWPSGKPMVLPEYPSDLDVKDVGENRNALVKHLRAQLAALGKPTVVDCTSIVDDLRFRLEWTCGPLFAESSYSPYRHAMELHRLPMHHAKKFTLARPFFLTFVVFPWFNSVITDFCDGNRTFYRSLARRVFCQYRSDPTLFSALYKKYTGAETVHEVMKELGGILFLEDRSISSESSDSTVKAYYYGNPNANRPVMGGLMEDYLTGLIGSVRGEIDDFRYDNY